MRRSVAMLLGVLAPVCSGCGSDAFVPPPPAELKAMADPSLEPAVKVIEMVLRPVDGSDDRELWAQIGRMDAASSRASFRSSAPEAGAPPQRQAELIRTAAARGASALIVEAQPDPKVADALKEVKARGTPVLLLARPLPGHEKEFPLVTLESPVQAAQSVVKAAIEDMQAAKLPKDGTAIILAPKTPDIFTDEQLAALKAAIAEAGIATPDVLAHDGTQNDAERLVAERLKSDPKLAAVFTVDGQALLGALDARKRAKKERNFIVAGFAEIQKHLEMLYRQSAAIADRHLSPMIRTAFRLAVQLAGGEQVAERTAIPIPFRRYASETAPDEPRSPVPPPPEGKEKK